jgi:hypothetical protein
MDRVIARVTDREGSAYETWPRCRCGAKLSHDVATVMTMRLHSFLATFAIVLAPACAFSDDDDASDDLVADGGPGDDDGTGGSADDGTMEPRCEVEDRDDDFALGLMREGEAVRVAIADAVPALPVRGDNSWTVSITDLEDIVMEGMLLEIRAWMPDHMHGSPVQPTTTSLGEGQYRIDKLNLFMAGYWEITITTTDTEGNDDSVLFKICVE